MQGERSLTDWAKMIKDCVLWLEMKCVELLNKIKSELLFSLVVLADEMGDNNVLIGALQYLICNPLMLLPKRGFISADLRLLWSEERRDEFRCLVPRREPNQRPA